MLISDICSQHFTYSMLFHCGETWQRLSISNEPLQTASWLAYQSLANHVLDPLADHFGMPTISYGFSGHELTKAIRKKLKPNISPPLDQHSACELNSKENLI